MKNQFLKIRNRLLKPVLFNDLSNVKPISNKFGFDRGIPIDRYYIEKFLEENNKHINGVLLEIAEKTYSERFKNNQIEKIEVLNINKNSKDVTIVGDLTNTKDLPENVIDCFICTQTFSFIYDFKKAIRGAFKLIKPGGTLLATLGGLSQISRYDMERWGDFWRFTSKSAKMIFSEVFGENNVSVNTYGNVLSAIAFLQGICCEDLKDISMLDQKDEDYQTIIGIVAKKQNG